MDLPGTPLNASEMETPRPKPHQAWSRVVETAENLRVLGSLTDAEDQRVADAIEVLTTVQTSERRKKYKRFLYDALRNSGPKAVLLVAAGLGQGRVVDMKTSDRAGLSHEINVNKDHPDMNHPTLLLLATTSQIPNSIAGAPFFLAVGHGLHRADLPLPLPQATIKRCRKRNRTAIETEHQAEIRAPEPNAEVVLPMQQVGSFAGRVFQLTIEDARTITTSGQVQGGVWLTDPYSGSLPFITISISQEMSHEFAMRRPQAM